MNFCRLNPVCFIECLWNILVLTVRLAGNWILLNGNGYSCRMIPTLGMNIVSPYAWSTITVACVIKRLQALHDNVVPAQRIGVWKFRKHFFFLPMQPHVLYGLHGLPSRLWPKCNRLLRLGRPWGAVMLSLCRWMVIQEHEVPRGALNFY
jgi:hypothetical protein